MEKNTIFFFVFFLTNIEGIWISEKYSFSSTNNNFKTRNIMKSHVATCQLIKKYTYYFYLPYIYNIIHMCIPIWRLVRWRVSSTAGW